MENREKAMYEYDVVMQELVTIIKIGQDAKASGSDKVVSFKGYYILREDLNRFNELLVREKDFYPSEFFSSKREAKLLDLPKGQLKDELKKYLMGNKEQFRRIEAAMLEMYSKKVEEASVIDNKNKFFPRDFMEVICLGIDGHLTKDMVLSLRSHMAEESFEELLGRLQAFEIFNNEEIEEFRKPPELELLSLDELVVYFAFAEDLNIKSLKILSHTIGIYNYQYIIDELFKIGVINVHDYIGMVAEFAMEDVVIGVDKYLKVLNDYRGNKIGR